MSNPLVGPIIRATLPNAVTIWTEWPHPCEITLTATPTDPPNSHRARAVLSGGQAMSATTDGLASTTSRTITVGERHYALSQLTGLQPATWYDYSISNSAQNIESSSPVEKTVVQCFRTLDLPDAIHPLRLAYGSCRKLATAEPDALSALGNWLLCCLDEREALWASLIIPPWRSNLCR